MARWPNPARGGADALAVGIRARARHANRDAAHGASALSDKTLMAVNVAPRLVIHETQIGRPIRRGDSLATPGARSAVVRVPPLSIPK